jgi:hypothetical protein
VLGPRNLFVAGLALFTVASAFVDEMRPTLVLPIA